MKAIVFGVVAIIAVVQGSVVRFLPASTTTLVRTPSFDSAVVHSQNLDGGFSYSTVENHAYAPVVHSVGWACLNLIKNWSDLFLVPRYRFITTTSTHSTLKCITRLSIQSTRSIPLTFHHSAELLYQQPQAWIPRIQLKSKAQLTIKATEMKTLSQLNLRKLMWRNCMLIVRWKIIQINRACEV